jgi:hypothetical protein
MSKISPSGSTQLHSAPPHSKHMGSTTLTKLSTELDKEDFNNVQTAFKKHLSSDRKIAWGSTDEKLSSIKTDRASIEAAIKKAPSDSQEKVLALFDATVLDKHKDALAAIPFKIPDKHHGWLSMRNSAEIQSAMHAAGKSLSSRADVMDTVGQLPEKALVQYFKRLLIQQNPQRGFLKKGVSYGEVERLAQAFVQGLKSSERSQTAVEKNETLKKCFGDLKALPSVSADTKAPGNPIRQKISTTDKGLQNASESLEQIRQTFLTMPKVKLETLKLLTSQEVVKAGTDYSLKMTGDHKTADTSVEKAKKKMQDNFSRLSSEERADLLSRGKYLRDICVEVDRIAGYLSDNDAKDPNKRLQTWIYSTCRSGATDFFGYTMKDLLLLSVPSDGKAKDSAMVSKGFTTTLALLADDHENLAATHQKLLQPGR